ncbi:MEDS domain-containing protein [Alicyclobacillus fodiniaquatilis]|uniref:MEDS domain-containing protein n=1 Tax=Alicyclobacillus fodiniaquatilis TaxID=1661150 RepID=A0ABW4JP42_9BACL
MKKREWLKQLRISRGLTQETVAIHSFIDRGFYAQIENGTRDPSMNVAENIAHTLGIHPQIFFVDHFQASHMEPLHHESHTIYAQCDLDLKYTWVFHPYCDVQDILGHRDDELATNTGVADLIFLKKQVLLQGVPLEKIIVFPRDGSLRPYLVRGEPLWDNDNRLIGVHTALTYMPALLSFPYQQHAQRSEPRGLFQGHALYFYDNVNLYTENLVRFITDGVECGYQLWIVENASLISIVKEKLKTLLSTEKYEYAHFLDNQLAYGADHFDTQHIANKFLKCIMRSVLKWGPIRIWNHVTWKEQDGMLQNLIHLEAMADAAILELGLTLVCAYDANRIPAVFQTNLLRCHEYLMTDTELVYSPLYTK